MDNAILGTLGEAVKQHKDAVKDLPLKTKLALVGGLVGGALLIVVLVYAASTVEYKVLYKGLSNEDAASVLQWLKQQKVSYRVGEDGLIEVPVDKVGETRLAMAAEGIPSGGGAGFELFDKQSISTTPFVQKVNYQRALQGELARSISSLDEVESARVHLSMPRQRLFAKDAQSPSASVVLKLAGRSSLGPRQVKAIVHLVSSSVQGLEPERVSVLDQEGRLLAGPGAGGDGEKAAEDKALAVKRNFEESLARQAENALSKLVGEGGVQVNVFADLDVSVTEATEERYDPDTVAVRSEQRITESHDGVKPQISGVVGARANVPGPDGKPRDVQGSVAQARERGNKAKTLINYEVSKVVRHTTSMPVLVKRLTVAVLVDKKALEKAGANAAVTTEKLESIVKRMVGFQEARGDEIDVMIAPFKSAEQESEKSLPFYSAPWFWKVLQYAVWLILGAIIFVLLVLPGIRAVKKLPTIEVLAKPVAELEASISGAEGTEPDDSDAAAKEEALEQATAGRDKVLAYVTANTDQATEVLRAWLREQEAE